MAALQAETDSDGVRFVFMEPTLSVNQALAQLEALSGEDVQVRGILSFDFEDVCISHFPKSERKEDNQSSIWLQVGAGALGFDEDVCRRLHGKRVVAEGTLFAADPTMGCGHMGGWPAQLLVRNLSHA